MKPPSLSQRGRKLPFGSVGGLSLTLSEDKPASQQLHNLFPKLIGACALLCKIAQPLAPLEQTGFESPLEQAAFSFRCRQRYGAAHPLASDYGDLQ